MFLRLLRRFGWNSPLVLILLTMSGCGLFLGPSCEQLTEEEEALFEYDLGGSDAAVPPPFCDGSVADVWYMAFSVPDAKEAEQQLVDRGWVLDQRSQPAENLRGIEVLIFRVDSVPDAKALLGVLEDGTAKLEISVNRSED